MKEKRIGVFLAEGFEEIEAVSVIDVLRRADIKVFVVSVTGKKEVHGSHDIILKADVLFEEVDFDNLDGIILPGGMPGAENLRNHAELQRQLIRFANDKRLLAAICAAPMVLGQAGILDHSQATCYPGFEHYLGEAVVKEDDVVIDHNIITGRGAGVAIPFALKIVDKLRGREKAEEIGKRMIVPV